MSVYVFLDTQVLMQKQFSMHDKLICDLIAKINSDKVKLVVSPIVIQELKKHVKQCVNKAYAALKKNFVLFAIPELHTIREQDNPEEYLSDRIIGIMQEKLFFNATNIPVSEANTQQVFEDYFAETFPFQGGKKEFPDAFMANSLLNWAKKNNLTIAIISGNSNDWKPICERDEYCDYLKYYSTIPDFLEYLSITSKRCEAEKEKIKSTVEYSFWLNFVAEFKNLDFSISDEHLAWDDYFSNPTVDFSSLKQKSNHINIIDYDSENGTAEVAMDVLCSFKSHIDIDDIDSGIYDSEEKGIIGYWDRLRGTVEAEREFSCTVTVHKEGEEYEIDSLEIDSPRSIELSWGHCSEYYDDDNFIPDPAPNRDE